MAAFKALATVAFMALVGAALHAGVTPAHADGATSPLVSVMVITHDRPQYLLHALQQIKEQGAYSTLPSTSAVVSPPSSPFVFRSPYLNRLPQLGGCHC